MKMANLVTKKGMETTALLGTMLIIILSTAFVWTLQAVSHFKKFEFELASAKAQPALFIIRPLSTLTLHSIPDIELWHKALTLIKESHDFHLQLTTTSLSLLQPPNDNSTSAGLIPLTASLETLTERISTLESHCRRSLIAKYQVNCDQINQLESLTQDWLNLQRWLTQENPTLIVLFQNTEELRATGGFMGSYARVRFNSGQLEEVLIEDIYEPDGQFTGYVPAPAGVQEYLSSGKGLRLPDANWHPDFPTSAQTILNYFALGKEHSIDGVITINSDLVPRLLTITGDVYLPDYSVTVTSDNFTTLARADRDQFFPGSQQKTNFLGHFFTVLKVKLSNLNKTQQVQLAMILQDSMRDKTIQLYSGNPKVQKVFVDHRVAGILESPDRASPLIYLVESNVGINKANKNVTRMVHLSVRPTQLTVSLDFNNQNSDLGYVNYQRVIVPLEWSVDPMALAPSLWIDGHGIRQFDEEIITNNQGQQFKQIGFLVTVPSASSVTVDLTFNTPSLTKNNNSLIILKQPGLPATPYTVTANDKTESFILEQDTIIKMSN